jgi:hypothetical protein
MASDNKSTYWENRKDSIYLHAAQQICRQYAGKTATVLDVGSNRTATLEWHRDRANQLVSLDLRNPYAAPGVESIKANFFSYKPVRKFELVTCFQVLEHVPNAAAFARKLLEVGEIVIVSVPYRWRKGACKYHIHDPVDAKKMLEWFGERPLYHYIARELNGSERLIQVYWPNAPEDVLAEIKSNRSSSWARPRPSRAKPWYAKLAPKWLVHAIRRSKKG